MLVVPVSKDIITTKDDITLKVVEYTNYKIGGPAVYAKSDTKELSLIYFFDIAKINGTTVEYISSSKMLNSFGRLNRSQQLPQPDDKVTILSRNITSDDSKGKEIIDVSTLKLKYKQKGISRGMFIKDTNGNYFRIKNILDIDRSLGNDAFDRSEFMKLYSDYLGI